MPQTQAAVSRSEVQTEVKVEKSSSELLSTENKDMLKEVGKGLAVFGVKTLVGNKFGDGVGELASSGLESVLKSDKEDKSRDRSKSPNRGPSDGGDIAKDIGKGIAVFGVKTLIGNKFGSAAGELAGAGLESVLNSGNEEKPKERSKSGNRDANDNNDALKEVGKGLAVFGVKTLIGNKFGGAIGELAGAGLEAALSSTGDDKKADSGVDDKSI
jgi:hypothetical protein